MIRTKYTEILRNDYNVEKKAEFEQIITNDFYALSHIYYEFKDYNFYEFYNEFRREFNCQSKHYVKFYLMINSGERNLFFGRFLVSSFCIPNGYDIEFESVLSYDERGDPTKIVDHILQKERYDEVKVCATMEVIFLLSASLTALSEYEEEQLEDLYDQGDNDDEVFPLILRHPETPFILDNSLPYRKTRYSFNSLPP